MAWIGRKSQFVLKARIHLYLFDTDKLLVQEGKRDAEALREKAQAAAAEAMDLRHALQTASARLKVSQPILSESFLLSRSPSEWKVSKMHALLSIPCNKHALSRAKEHWHMKLPGTGKQESSSNQSMVLQEQEAALSEVTEMAQRQKACIMALNKERAELAARSADPAQVAALRSEAAQLHERLRSFTAIKVTHP